MLYAASRQYVTIHAKECRSYIYVHLVVSLLYLITLFKVMDYFIQTSAQRAQTIYAYKNTKEKLQRTNTAILV